VWLYHVRQAAQRWIDAAPREVWTDLDNTEIQRQEAIFELITTERSYVEYLENTITVNQRPLPHIHLHNALK
jgi:hypothetical protein